MVRLSGTHAAPMIPCEPFRAWIEVLVWQETESFYWTEPGRTRSLHPLSPMQRVAARLGVSEGRLRRWRNPRMEWVREDAVDRACCHEGTIHMSELFPVEYLALAQAGGPRQLLEAA